MRKVLLIIAALLCASPALADNYTATQGSGTTFAAKNIGGVLYPWWIPANSSGTELFTSGNAAYVQFPSAQSVSAVITTGAAVIGQVNQAAASSPWVVSGNVAGTGAAGAALSGNPFRMGISDGTNAQNVLNAVAMGDTNAGTGVLADTPMWYNGATFNRAYGDATNGLWVNCKSGCSSSTAITSWGGGTLGAMANYGSTPGAVLVPGMNAFVTNTNANGAATDANSAPVALSTTQTGSAGTAATRVLTVQGIASMTPILATNTPAQLFPSASTPITASATGTTAATTATLAGTGGKTTYICGFSIRANATSAVTNNATVTGTITGTLNFTQWTAPLATGLGVTEEVFMPCVPASGTNQGIAVISGAPGSGGVVSSTAWGYQQ